MVCCLKEIFSNSLLQTSLKFNIISFIIYINKKLNEKLIYIIISITKENNR